MLERLFTLAFKRLVYPQIWEDPVVDMRALDIGPGHEVIAIASGGCNVLSYLTADPAGVTADLLAYMSHLRNAMRRARTAPSKDQASIQPGRGIIEFPETLTVDDVPEDGLAFNPKTCLRDLK